MAVNFDDVNENFRRIALTGRLDIPGTEEISTKFTALAVSEKRRVVVDLTGVSFLASIGIRTLISAAKALQQRGGRMVLFVGGNNAVAKTLQATGIDALLPTFTETEEADKAAVA
ncbi:MAG TPA: STAS domain-containing protein [Burkholderiales bacterium]|nr:STAS domain-containing protein [Burkholderiales bacterium]